MLDIWQYINTHLFIYIPVELFYSFGPIVCSERPWTGQSDDWVLLGLQTSLRRKKNICFEVFLPSPLLLFKGTDISEYLLPNIFIGGNIRTFISI